jgi:coiled-coil domain-containing protein 55
MIRKFFFLFFKFFLYISFLENKKMQQNKHFKYGLNLSTKKPSQRSIFSEDDDDDNTTTKNLNSTRKVNKTLISRDTSLSKSVQEQHKAALEEDPTVYSYDEVYDDMKNAEKKTLQALKGVGVSSNKVFYYLFF